MSAGGGRLLRLDSLRGLAALIVVANHYIQAIPEAKRNAFGLHDLAHAAAWASPWTWMRFTPLRLFVNGQAAVDLFFVLSGFVLAMQANRAAPPTAASFFIRRVCRVYLPFAAVILVLYAAWHFAPRGAEPSASGWLQALRPPAGGVSLLGHLAMTGRPGDMILDPPMWTLVHEMRMSLVMPALFFAIRRYGPLPVAAAVLAVSILACSYTATRVTADWPTTARYAWLFAAGAALAWQRQAIALRVAHLKRGSVVGLWAFAAALSFSTAAGPWGDFPAGLGALLTIALALRENIVARLLESKVPLWLGRVSYSLYLIHLPILTLALTCGLVRGPSLGLLAATLLVSEGVYRAVEAPCHRLGAIVSARFSGGLRIGAGNAGGHSRQFYAPAGETDATTSF